MSGMGGGHGGGMGGSMMMQHGQQESGHKMGGTGGMGMSHGADALAPGSEFEIMRFQITQETSDSPALPHQLSVIERYTLDDVANPGKPVPIAISEGPMAMLLNGRPYAMDDFLPEERIPVNTLQLMEIFHNHGGEGGGHGSGHGGSGGMNMAAMMSMAHPIHIHEQPFQIISRSMSDDGQEAYASVHEGLVDSGWKDTVLVLPGERVRIIKPFREFKGRYMMHCHNLEHEDMGMMRDLLVE
jgi:hypothetical protein